MEPTQLRLSSPPLNIFKLNIKKHLYAEMTSAEESCAINSIACLETVQMSTANAYGEYLSANLFHVFSYIILLFRFFFFLRTTMEISCKTFLCYPW